MQGEGGGVDGEGGNRGRKGGWIREGKEKEGEDRGEMRGGGLLKAQ